MHNELTNLLPFGRQRVLRRDYFVRLGVVLLVLLTVLTASAAVLLVPTYVFLAESARSKEVRLAGIESTLSSSEETELSEQLTALSVSTAALSALASTPSISEIIRAMLALPRPGITLSGFGYSPATGKNRGTSGTKSNVASGTFTVSGRAATRDALRNYQLALESAPFAQSADLPVSAYAKDTDITFTITVTTEP